MTIAELPIMGSYDKQRFIQFSPEDCANWSLIQAPSGKKKTAMYPVMGRHHVISQGQNVLIFPNEPRLMDHTINYWYAVVSNNIYRIDKQYNQVQISGSSMNTLSGNVFFTYLVTGVITFVVFVDGQNMFVYQEPINNPDGTVTPGAFSVITDPLAPKNPTYVATFGSRIVASNYNSSQFSLSAIGLQGSNYNPATAFTIANAAVFAQASGIIKQFAVLNNTLYIFSDFTTDIWSDIPSQVTDPKSSTTTTFPWKKSSSYNWDFGMADPLSLDVDFHRMVWLAQNQNGLVQIMISNGGLPERLSTKAIDVLFQKNATTGQLSPFLANNGDGFLYQYENTIYYRLSAGQYMDFGILDIENSSNSIEYNFDTNTWTRCIEANGERNRIQKHIFFNFQHLVSLSGDNTVYEMSGQYYDNEITNPDEPNPQVSDSYISLPFRYERITPIIAEDDYAEFITDFLQIDFVFGNATFINTLTPFSNTVFIIDELPSSDGSPLFLVTETDPNTFIIAEGNLPDLTSTTYNKYFKPHIELYFSNDAGINYFPADVREFSQLGVYQWRMRWYQLGVSRNRAYRLVCVSPAPIIILGAIHDVRRVSGGAY